MPMASRELKYPEPHQEEAPVKRLAMSFRGDCLAMAAEASCVTSGQPGALAGAGADP